MKSACFIPIKANSERVPGKNFRLLNGHKLYEYIITHAIMAECFDDIFIDTNSDEIGDAVLTVPFGNLSGTVKDDVESFRMDAHLHISGVFRKMVQEFVNLVNQSVAKGGCGLYFLSVHTVSVFEPQRYIFYVDGLHGPSR